MKEFLDFHTDINEKYHQLPGWWKIIYAEKPIPKEGFSDEQMYFYQLDAILAFINYIQKTVKTYQQ